MSSMVKALLSLVKPPVFGNPDQMHQARLLHTIILTIFAAMVLFTAAFLVINPDRLERLIFVTILVPPFAAARVLLLRGQIRQSGFLVVSALWVMLTLTVFTGGGIRGPGVPAYVVPVALAGFLLGWRVGVVYTALTILSCAVFALAELAGWQPTVIVYSPVGMLVIKIAILVVVIVLVSLADRGTNRALTDSRLNERRFQQTFDDAPIGMALVGPNGAFLQVNQAFCGMLGYSKTELLTKTFHGVTHPDDIDREIGIIRSAARDGSNTLSIDKRYLHKDGHVVWGRMRASLVRDGEGKPSYYIGQIEDITEQRRAHERIRKLNRIYRLLSNINQAIVRTRDLKLLYPNVCRIAVEDGDFLLAWVGLTVPSSGVVEVVARYGAGGEYPVTSFMLLDDDPTGWEPVTKAIVGGQRVICNDIAALDCPPAWRERMLELGYRATVAFPLMVNGEARGVFNLFTAEPDHFDEDELTLLDELAMDLGFAMEVAEEESARRRAEDMLGHSEERYRQLAEDMPALICTFLPDSTLTYVNAAYSEYFQRSPEELIGKRFLDFLPDEEVRHDTQQEYLRLTPQVSKEITEHPVLAPTGEYRWQQWVNRAFFDASGQLVSLQAVGVDITERKLAEQALRASEERYRELVDSLADFVFVVDQQGNIMFANPAVEAMTGYAPEEIVGRPFSEYLHPDDLPALMSMFQEAVQGRAREEIDGAEQDIEGRIIRRDGEAIWIMMRGSMIEDSSGQVRGIRGVARDITERKLAEARRLEAETLRIELEKEREMSELKTRFVSMVSHEFRTPLAVIFLASSTVLTYSDRLSDERKAEKLTLIQSQVKRLEAILEDTLFITRDELGKLKFAPTRIDLEKFGRELAQDVEQLGQTERIEVSSDGRCGMVSVDTNLLRHILINLLSNALKYSPEDRTVRLELDCADGQVVLRVQDQGIGIPEDDLRHLFEPFHRAWNVGEISGTGLGLTIVKRSVEAHGGTIQVESQVGEGTMVTVWLPVGEQVSRR
ncbi:MAG: PAS domain S-box protein [Anaerolineae bacterium]|nr:PAS domain S-box protein [Anaerolineae bacterium]